MNDISNIPNENEEVVAPSFFQKYRQHVILAAIALVLVVALILSIVWLVKAGDFTTTQDDIPYFDYEASKPLSYMTDFSLDKFKGLSVGGKGQEVTLEITDDYVKDYINVNLLLAQKKATNKSLAERSTAITYADEVYFYVLGIYKDGERVLADDFGRTYEEKSMVVGSLYFGKDFDEKIIGFVPMTTSLEMRNNGAFSATDIISATYTATVKDEKTPTVSLSGARIDLAQAEEGFRNAILAASTTVGKQFEFDYTEDIDGDGETEEVHYVMTVNTVVTENAASVTFTFPESYFSTNMDEEYTALNGQEVTVRLVVDYFVAYDAYTLDTLLTEDLVETEEGKDDVKAEAEKAASLLSYTGSKKSTTKQEVIDAVKEEQTTALKEQLKEEKESIAATLIGNHYMSYTFQSLPQSEIDAYHRYYGIYYFEAFVDSKLYNTMTYDGFAVNVGLGYVPSEDENEPQNFYEYIIDSATYSVKQNLVLAWLYHEAGLNTEANEKEIKDGYPSFLYNQYGTSDEKELKKAGLDLDVLYKDYHLQSIAYYVNQWMLANNTIDFTKEPIE
ncbi:MAG: hypothetical protein J6K61_03525 [Clostridia bacterium]|nr:hypothetical protein [Clostridia bacterium]